MPSFTFEGASLAFDERGTGTPLLLLHAFPFSREMFRLQLEALSAYARVVTMDIRGFGESTGTVDPLEMSRIARDAFALLSHLGIGGALVGGVSMGGYAAMAMVREDASRVRGLLLADTQALADDAEGKQRREQTAQTVLRGGIGTLATSMPEKLLAPAAPASLRAEVERMIRGIRAETAAAASRGMGLRPDSRELLARFHGPALILVGEKDVPTPPERARQMHELLHGSTLVTLPGAGHLANLEQPVAFNRTVESWLASIPR